MSVAVETPTELVEPTEIAEAAPVADPTEGTDSIGDPVGE